ncbi:MAG: pitrilysin family protein, partial [candidate division WOR-3 bacterium]
MKNNFAFCLLNFAFCILIPSNSLCSLPLFRDSLDSGLIILTYEDHRLPMVDISFVCRSGAAFDPVEKAGVASLCAQMLLRGTKNLSADSITTILDFLGARYYSGADFDHSYLNLRLLVKDFNTGLGIIADIVRNPAFAQQEFERAREEALMSSRRSYDHPNAVVSMEFDRLLFGGHRYALPVRGDTNTIPQITIEDLRQFHQKHFVPNNCFIVVVGDIDHQQVKNEIAQIFARWLPEPVPLAVAPEPV